LVFSLFLHGLQNIKSRHPPTHTKELPTTLLLDTSPSLFVFLSPHELCQKKTSTHQVANTDEKEGVWYDIHRPPGGDAETAGGEAGGGGGADGEEEAEEVDSDAEGEGEDSFGEMATKLPRAGAGRRRSSAMELAARSGLDPKAGPKVKKIDGDRGGEKRRT
jgi:hypothetical protein